MPRPATDPIGRVAAAAMVACGIVHVAAAFDHWTMSPVLSGLTAVVALTCLHCVAGLWRRPGRAEWVWVTLGSGAMLVLHLAMIVTMAAPSGGGHAHRHTVSTGIATAADTGADALTILGLLLPLLGLGLAWWALGRSTTVQSLRTSWSLP